MVRQDVAEERILDTVRERILSREAIAHAVRVMREMARAEASAPPPELERIEAQIAELTRLRDAGILSPEIAGAALARAYREREQARRPSSVVAPLFGAEAEYVATAEAMREAIIGDDIPAAREALREILGPIRLHPREDHLVAELTAGRVMALAVNWNGSGGRIWIQLTRDRAA